MYTGTQAVLYCDTYVRKFIGIQCRNLCGLIDVSIQASDARQQILFLGAVYNTIAPHPTRYGSDCVNEGLGKRLSKGSVEQKAQTELAHSSLCLVCCCAEASGARRNMLFVGAVSLYGVSPRVQSNFISLYDYGIKTVYCSGLFCERVLTKVGALWHIKPVF